ncbi:MAG: tRNA threonylcarbamoyladenosine biosynthesis protein TsaE [Thermosipho sp. (in: thermotogales)]|nr:tRNA threonylcarbamoyladenosine biosynthesis protein TsaE [Thermosipho sp. (in: thermotogales)]MDN5324615.1 tRNA threonylcarbamoyladenosine biosynthesis protein TsaE [Thermosipho sp. (in: thermotogales)]
MAEIYINDVSLEKLRYLSSTIANNLNKCRFIFLNGDLGTGKTTFVKFFCENFGISAEDVSSPTFTVVNVYSGVKTIYHVDLYRLNDIEELFYVLEGQLEDEEGIFLIEWANIFPDYFIEKGIEIELKHKNNDKRDLIIKIPENNQKLINELRRCKDGEKFETKI